MQTIPVDLRSIPLLKGLTDQELTKVSEHLVIKELAANQTILEQHEVPAYLLIVLSGQLQATVVNEEGRIIAMFLFGNGSIVGLEPLIDSLPLDKSIVTSRKTKLLLIPSAIAKSIISHPSVSPEVLKILSRTVRQLTDGHRLLGLPSAFQRVYSLILDFAQRDVSSNQAIRLPKQHEFAIMVNASRETVSRAIHALIKRGVLKKSGSQIAIQDIRELQRLALEGVDKPID